MKHPFLQITRWLIIMAVGWAIGWGLPQAIHATVWQAGPDLVANELPDGNPNELLNPNGTVPAWSYGYRSTLSGALTLFADGGGTLHTNAMFGIDALEGWLSNNGYGVPAVGVNVTGTPTPGGLGPSEVFVHPGDVTGTPGQGPYVVVRWTAPQSTVYSIAADWQALSDIGNGVDVHLLENGVSLFDGLTVPGASPPVIATQQFRTLSVGDTLEFVVGPNGSFASDSTAFNATIMEWVPEPGSLALLAVGGLLVWRRMRK